MIIAYTLYFKTIFTFNLKLILFYIELIASSRYINYLII
jgi:hypothetical protein